MTPVIIKPLDVALGDLYKIWTRYYCMVAGRPTFKAYVENIEAKSGRKMDDFLKLATKKGFVKRGRIVAEYSDMMAWLKSKKMDLGHVHASFVILYMRLRTKDEGVNENQRKWAHRTGYLRQQA